MKSAIVICIVAMVVACSLVKADLTISPTSIAFHLAGGSTITRSIAVDWNGNIITAARISTNITPNGTGLYVSYGIPIWNGYFFLQPKHENISMIIAANPALKPGNYTIRTVIEVMTEAQIIIKNNTVTVVDPWIQSQYALLTGNYNSLQENLTVLFVRNSKLQKDVDNETAKYNREKQSAEAFRTLLIVVIIAIGIGLVVTILFRRRYPLVPFNETLPNGVRPIEEQKEQITIVGRRHK
jgi:hypothetical protein